MSIYKAEAEMLAEFIMYPESSIEELELNEADFNLDALDIIL